MRLQALVEVSRGVAATRSRTRKLELLVEALGALERDELVAGLAYLSGEPRQDRLDLGPAAVYGSEAPPAAAPTLTLAEVDTALQEIADVEAGSGSRSRRLERFTDLLARATGEEQGFLRALVLRELRQGALEGLLTSAVARATGVDEATVRRAAMLSGDLRATAVAAVDGGATALAAFRLRVGTPLQPMLATAAADVAEVIDQLAPRARGGDLAPRARGDDLAPRARGDDSGEVAVEAKLDGARVQIHRDGERITVFTRNLADVTHRVPEVVATVRSLELDQVVLDAEVLTFDEHGRPRPFQDTMARFGRGASTPIELSEIDPDQRLALRAFDVLHLDGADLLDRPLGERREALAGAVPGELRVAAIVTDDATEASDFLREVLAAGHEGVMLKDLDAPYEAGRRGASWRKVKPVYTLDLVVLAAEWGSGRRRGWLSNLHLGCLDVDATSGAEGLVMLGKTFKGLTDELLAWQTAALLERETHRAGHIVHVRPELVVEIALDGLVRSTRYPGGLALRFARVRSYRPDKAPTQADTLATARALHAGQLPPNSTPSSETGARRP